MKQLIVALGLCCIFFTGCDNQPVPRPKGYNRIDIPVYKYLQGDISDFTFEYSALAKIIVKEKKPGNKEVWFDIRYPNYNAVLHCTYLAIDRKSLSKVLDDNHRLVYSHVSMADAIDQKVYEDTENKVSGILYTIEGDVATPVQFFVTDSVANFVRGSLYYESATSVDSKIETDSVTPITEMVKKDASHLMMTLRWKKQ